MIISVSSTGGTCLLKIENLSVHFATHDGEVHAVDGVNLKVMKEEVIGLVGESGCGKSTLARTILRLIPRPPGKILSGRILYKGNDMLELSEKEMVRIRGKEISMVFQDPMTFLNPVLRVEDQISEVIIHKLGVSKKEAKRRALESLGDVMIPSPEKVANYYPHQMSGGMLQRVLIAIALCCDPSLVVADEPTTALDVTLQAQILKLMSDLKRRLLVSVILVTHDLGIVADISDRVYVMYAGKIVEGADVFDIYKRPLHPYTKGLLNSVLSLDEFRENAYSIKGVVPSLIDPPRGCRFHPRCDMAMEICKKRDPPAAKYDEGHVVSCWLYEGTLA